MTHAEFDTRFGWMNLSSLSHAGPATARPVEGHPSIFSSSLRALRFFTLVGASMLVLGLILSFAPTSDVSPARPTGGQLSHPVDGTITVPVVPTRAPESEPYPVQVAWLGNPGPRDGRADFILVHGMDHDSDVWWPLARRLLDRRADRVHRVYMLDLPGHGASSWPADRTFGQVGLEDYVDALRAAIAMIQQQDGSRSGATILAGHSMGGMVVQMLQARLLDEGGSLRQTFGIDRVMLFAATMPDGLPFQAVHDLPVIAHLAHMIGYSRSTGLVIGEPDDAKWSRVFFSRHSDSSPYGLGAAPRSGVRYMNNLEPGRAGMEMMGFDWDLSRPIIPEGEFSTRPCADTGRPCYTLVSVGFDEDQYVRPDEVLRLHQYLTGSSQPCIGAPSAAGACAILAGPHDGVWSGPGSPREAAALDQAIDDVLVAVDEQAVPFGKSS